MKSVWGRVIMVAGIGVLLVAVYFLFGTGPRYKSLSQQEAAKIMDNNPDCMIVDVRTQTEYDGGHIPGAVCVPVDDIRQGHTDAFPDKHQVLLIYCYAGRRAADAAQILASMGYTNAYEFGGIVDWTGPMTEPVLSETETEPSGTES